MTHSKTIMLTLAMAVSSLAGAAQAASFEATSPVIRSASTYGSAADDKPTCMCELVNGRWKCLPVGCVGQFSSTNGVDLRWQSIERETLPGEQFLRIPPSPGEGTFRRGR